MTDKKYPKSGLPIRRSAELLPNIFQTESNKKFFSGVVDPIVQPGVLEKITGYIGRRYGKTFNSKDIYLDSDETLRSRYQLEPGVIIKNKNEETTDFYDYLDFKNQLRFFGNKIENDDRITEQTTYTWDPPINWDQFVNFREYYWEPLGPPPVRIAGNAVGITSSYKVSIGAGSSWIFSPDGFSNNPTLTLYRGQKYRFRINAPGQPFYIKTNYDTGSLLFDPNKTYFPGQLVLFDNKLWRAKVEISPSDGSTIDESSQDWQFVERAVGAQSFNYNEGVSSNGLEVGDLEFEVPFNAPDILFYQSGTDPDRLGRFLIANIDTNTFVDVEKEIIGKIDYSSGNGIEFTNGLIVSFSGRTFPSLYQKDTWLVEGVGSGITLTKFSDLTVPKISSKISEVFFDDEGFDTQPFDDAEFFPSEKDYILIARDSKDFNAWSRYNRWFHRSVLEFSYKSRGQDFPADENLRAKRPIIEFQRDLQLFNHGSVAKQAVDFIDDFTDDIFSTIEGSSGYNVDNEFLFDGARLLVTADTDSVVNNKIYVVRFITHLGNRQIHLEESRDSKSINGECLLIKRGIKNSGLMFHFNGRQWVKSQEKTLTNQPPLFDVFDEQGISFSDLEKYETSDFIGSKLLSYKIGKSIKDKELGFSLSYLNIDNIGDIEFSWDWEFQSFSYILGITRTFISLASGYYRFNNDKHFSNGWIEKDKKYSQILIDTDTITNNTNELISNIIDWSKIRSDKDYEIIFELNGSKLNSNFSREDNKFIFDKGFNAGDVLVTKLLSVEVPERGYYEIPCALEKNPLNNNLTTFTFGEASDHVDSALEFNKELKGVYPGVSNLRDLEEYRKFGKRFLKHSEIAPISLFLLCDKDFNLIKSIRYASKSYNEFKNNLIKKSTEAAFDNDISNFLDSLLSEINKVKSIDSQFSASDMLGTGAFNSIAYTVEDEGIKTFSLSEKFNLKDFSNRAVYVYYDQKQLIHGRDYEFNENFGFIVVKIPFKEGDILEIREYNSTSFCFIPPTPTKLGLYKKFQPKKFLDNTYQEPREVIQGHDGSITVAFGDYRDDLLLEFETRIYNNLKYYDYERVSEDVDFLLGNYYHDTGFSKEEIDNLISQDFLRWASNTDFNYSRNDFFDSENSFTYTYSEMTDPLGEKNLPGFWRGVYRWFYDTDKPHVFPWEMLGFSEKPDWWEREYGPEPYTRGNLILWEDLENGIIRKGNRAGTYERYKRPGLTKIIPVDDHGELLSPLDSGLAQNFVLINNRESFKFGDIAPVEYSWRSSSEYPFALIVAFCLLRPFDFVGNNLDKTKIRKNKISQTISSSTNSFIKIKDLISENDDINNGLISYVIDYLKFLGISSNNLFEKIEGIDVNLSSRISGFVDKDQQKYLLDTKNSKSSSSSIFIPPENYEIFFDVSSPIDALSYSGVIIEKTATGWSLSGYDFVFPYFEYYEAIANQRDPLISVGGVSAGFQNWEENKTYNNGQLVLYKGDYYRSIRTHNSGNEFDKNQWSRLPKLPIIGGVEALQRSNFNKNQTNKLSYGSELKTIQSVVDFLLGYEQFLIDKGFVFDRYDKGLGVSRNWITSAKEFMFWTRQNWAIGSLISLSPASQEIEIKFSVGVADNLLDSFYDYQILKSDGTPISPDLIDVNRDFQKTVITINNQETSNGLYFLKISYVIKEHVVIFDDKTVFNDVIFDETTGYRQERIKTRGFRTVDWDGDYTSPGFLFDNVNIDAWEPFKDYRLGDVVSYRSILWTSKINQAGIEFFDDNSWSRLDSTPTKKLIPNFDYRINLFEDYFETSSEGIGQVQRDLARHAVGYQPRQYLENLLEDPTSQFLIYQGYIREKGTKNSIVKVFDKPASQEGSSVEIYDEWAIRIGRLGGIDQIKEIEFKLDKDKFSLNPQPLVYNNNDAEINEKYYSIGLEDVVSVLQPDNEGIFSVKNSYFPSLTAGYVKFDQIEIILPSYDDFSNLNINSLKENNHIWVTFDINNTWNVYRFNRSQILYSTIVVKESNKITVTLNRKHFLKENDFVGFKIENLFGFFKIFSTTNDSITFLVDNESEDPDFELSTFNPLWILTPMRFKSYKSLEFSQAALLPNSSKIWIDQDENDQWEVVEKKKQFKFINIDNYGISTPLSIGKKVIYDDINKLTITSMPDAGFVLTYYRLRSGLSLRQIIAPPLQLNDNVLGSFGEELSISPDSRWLFVGSPLSNEIPSDYKGNFNPSATYVENDVVLFAGSLFRATGDVFGDGSTLNVYTQDWEPAKNIPAYGTASGSGLRNQGVVFVYEFIQQQWQLRQSFVSPRPEIDENFGTSIAIGFKNGEYTAAISAPGALGQVGRVYLYKLVNNEWVIAQNPDYKGIYNSGTSFVGNITISSGISILEVESIQLQGKIEVGMVLDASDLLPQTVVSEFISGINGGVGRYRINKTQILSSRNFTAIVRYPKGSIVWYDGSLWQSKEDNVSDFSTIGIDSIDWLRLSDVTTTGSLPRSVSIDDDGSTLTEGLLGDLQLAEMVKKEDRFGTRIAMDYSGDILAVGVPDSDGQFFANYRGIWRPEIEYTQDDVVKFQGFYKKLVNDGSVPPDSTITSYNQEPSGLPWEDIGDSSVESTGKVFVYQKNNNNRYELRQTITSGNLNLYSDLESGLTINAGDQFGFSLDIDYSGSKLIVSSPKADKNFQNQGSVYIFEKEISSSYLEYRLKQKLESFEDNPNEYFGQDVKISPNTEKIVVGAKNSPYISYSSFDFNRTTFDRNETNFYESKGFAGAVYVFEQKDSRYFLVEKLEADLSSFESFGFSVDCTDSLILVGSPDFVAPSLDENLSVVFSGAKIGMVRLFEKIPNVKSWEILEKQQSFVDLSKIKKISLYDTENSLKILDLDLIDPINFKILNLADREIKFKTEYDPAAYNVGDVSTSVIDDAICWKEHHVGEIWWDISTARWINYNQGDINYKISNWGRLAPGSSIRIFEWVESRLLPSEWSILADTTEGLAAGISGQPLYPNDENYTIKEIFNTITGESTETLYYYWVQNKNTLPDGRPERKISAADISILIRDPSSLGFTFAALVDRNTIIAYNFDRIFRSDSINLNIVSSVDDSNLNNIHNEYQILSEETVEDEIDPFVELKWLDSLIGVDTAGNKVPDENLPEKQKYGILFRPRQSIFRDRIPILKDTIVSLNRILKTRPFVDQIDLSGLLSKEDFPSDLLNLYDEKIEQDIDLQNVGTVRVRQARLSANIIDGAVDTIDIINPGFGYKVPPPIDISGDGINAEAIAVIDNQGRIVRVNITNRGRKYAQAIITVRPFSVLVLVDKTQNNLWSIYSWDDARRVFFRSRTQSFDTSKFWKYVDWWKEGYSEKSRIVRELDDFYQESSFTFEIGDLIKISNYGIGGWAVLEKIKDENQNFIDNFSLVGRQNGTIEISDQFYDTRSSGIGFDGSKSFDTGLYDIENTKELRNILESFKKDIFVNELKVEWKKLFFKSLRYVFVDQKFVDWVFKTSFVKVKNNIGFLEQKINFKNDNVDSYLDYFNEVKPYKTKVRSFITNYQDISTHASALTDFDLPTVFSAIDGKIITVGETNSLIETYPWRWWLDNNGYELTAIEIIDSGQGYTSPPQIIINGDGFGASARAYISNGRVSKILVESPGENYKTAPQIILVGGTRNENIARASAILGRSKIRTFDIKLKFDRITKDGIYTNFVRDERYTASGNTSVFDLKYPPKIDKRNISVEINNELVLSSEYEITFFEIRVENNNILKGRITFNFTPEKDSIIDVSYQINDDLLDSVNRIERYYQPEKGMKFKQPSQLMTGIDFGGVKIQGTTFDVTGGWDALPWFTDTWDSVSSNSDYYFVLNFNESVDSSEIFKPGALVKINNKIFVCIKENLDEDGDRIIPFESDDWEEFWKEFFITLPFVPADNQRINVYRKRVGDYKPKELLNLQFESEIPESPTVRIDDPNFNVDGNSSMVINKNALMPTIVGDGSTSTVDINTYDLDLKTGDTLIFRVEESDGSITINDRNILDTQLSGGSLSSIAGSYSTATGVLAEEIVSDGSMFVSPEQVPSPEETVPGQVLESLSIKVFNNTTNGAAPLESFVTLSDGLTKNYKIGLRIIENNSVMVQIDKIQKTLGIDYEIIYNQNSIELSNAPPQGSLIEITVFGVGGVGILDVQEFEADGDTNLFLTNANFTETANVYVTVNGEFEDVQFINSSDILETQNRTLIQFGVNPEKLTRIKVIVLSSSFDTDSTAYNIVRINKESFTYDGSTRKFDLKNFVNLQRGSVLSNFIVEVDGRAVRSLDTIVETYVGNNSSFILGTDPLETSGSILPSNIKVFINKELKEFVRDYDYDGISKNLIINSSLLKIGDIIKIEVNLKNDFLIENNDLILSDSLNLNEGDVINVTWFSEYPTMDIVADEFTAGKVNYRLKRIPLDISYVWVYKNGVKLSQDKDFFVSGQRLYLRDNTDENDIVKIIQFGSEIYKNPIAFEIYKDMFNIDYFRRYSIGKFVLSKDLNYYDKELFVENADSIYDPSISGNPGILTVNAEKLAYFKKEGNKISQLRRGILGSSIAEFHKKGSKISDFSETESIPYSEEQQRYDFVGDGSSLLIGPLPYIPVKAQRNNWFSGDIPEEYGPCYQIEVFLGGRRLRKDPIEIYDENLGSYSPLGDRKISAEFSVDGVTPFIRLSEPAPAGLRIVIIRKQGRLWYDRKLLSISPLPLIQNLNKIPKFIANKDTDLPE
jgi:hypothetical protein